MTKLTSITFAILIITACNTTKNSVKPTVSAVYNNSTSNNSILLKPTTGIYEPGDIELAAIKTQFTDATLDQLKQGYSIYTKGACVRCHGAVDVYEIKDSSWPHLLEDMTYKARITDSEKDAVNKYVLAIKAIKNKG